MNKPDKGGIVAFDFASLYHFTFKIQWFQNLIKIGP